jgi:hypothetical protein
MKLTPLTETLGFFLLGSFVSVMTFCSALGVDPFDASIPQGQLITRATK